MTISASFVKYMTKRHLTCYYGRNVVLIVSLNQSFTFIPLQVFLHYQNSS